MNDVIINQDSWWQKIANFLICKESISNEQKQLPLIYDGLIYADRCTCGTKYRPTVDEVDLNKIISKNLVVTGTSDKSVPYYFQKNLNDSLEQSDQLIYEGSGHFPINDNPMAFYEAVEELMSQ